MDVERRIAAGNKVTGALAALMRRRNVIIAARLAVHNAELVPTLLYGSETWVLQRKKKANAVEMLSLRDRNLTDRIPNKEIHIQMAGTREDVTVRMKKNLLRWFGHVERMSDDRRACMKMLMTVDEAKEVCRYRNVWRSVLSDYPARDIA